MRFGTPYAMQVGVAQQGKSRSRERTKMKKTPVKKGSKLGSVKPLKAGLHGNSGTVAPISPLKKP